MIYKETIEERLAIIEEKYQGVLVDIKSLEKENVESTNSLYELHNIIDRIEMRMSYLETIIIGDNK